MKDTTVFIRVDASTRTGGGHLSRCLALADAFRETACIVEILCGDIDDSYARLVAQRGYQVRRLDASCSAPPNGTDDNSWFDADSEAAISIISTSVARKKVLVVDHYRIDCRWEAAVAPHVDCVFVIDDLADRCHECSILLDQTFSGGAARYKGLLPEHCRCLLGPSYALLRPDFARLRRTTERRFAREDDYAVHVFFGSEDARANTHRFSSALMALDKVREVRAAVSAQFRHVDLLQALETRHAERFSWCVPGDGMAAHMVGCDVAIGAPGQATWERACLGLPAAYVAISDTQVPLLQHLSAVGFCAFLGVDRQIEDGEFRSSVGRFLDDASQLVRLRGTSMEAVDGLGAARAVDAALSG